MKIFPKSELKTKFETMLQLTSLIQEANSKRIVVESRKMSLKIKLNCLRTNKIIFSLLRSYYKKNRN